MTLENIIPVPLHLWHDETGYNYEVCHKKGDSDNSTWTPEKINAVGVPIIINYKELEPSHKEQLNMQRNLESYLKRAFAEHIIDQADSPLYLGYLRGNSIDIQSKAFVYDQNKPLTEAKERFQAIQFYLVE